MYIISLSVVTGNYRHCKFQQEAIYEIMLNHLVNALDSILANLIAINGRGLLSHECCND